MARLLGPDMGSRAVFLPSGTPASGKTGTVYSDAAGTVLADIAAYQPDNPTVPGDSITDSRVTVDAYGLLELFWYPDGVDRLWITVNGGPLVPIVADLDARLDSLTVDYDERIDAKQDELPTGATSQFLRGDKTFVTVTKANVGLENVDNTADVDKPVSAATQAELDLLAQAIEDSEATQAAAVTAAIATAADTQSALRDAAARRERPPRWSLAADGLDALTTTGLTVTSEKIAASVDGTNGDAIFPIWGTRKEWRAGFRVTCTKATASSRSTVGFTVSTSGVLPTSGQHTFGVGYKAGSGICWVRDNVGADVTIVADSAINDGDEYDVGVWCDVHLTGRGNATASLTAKVVKVADGTTTLGLTNFNRTNFPVRNVLVRTNVAAGAISDLKVANHPAAAVGQPAAAEVAYTTGGATETAFLHLPAEPNGRLVLALHGHGGSAQETGWTSTTYRPTWNALIGDGYTIAVPKMGGDLWGNTTAQAHVLDVYTQLVTAYDLLPEVYVWGNSMGGGAAATLISNRPFPVKAAYLAQPALDYDSIASNPSFATINTAYPSSGLRDASNPLKRASSTYTGVPLMIVASSGDTTIGKTTNADALATLAGTSTTVVQVAASGNHNDANMFQARTTLDWFNAAG